LPDRFGRAKRGKVWKYWLAAHGAARLEAGLTQVEVGKRSKKPQAYISKIERGERGVDAVELAEFTKLYGKSMNYFV